MMSIQTNSKGSGHQGLAVFQYQFHNIAKMTLTRKEISYTNFIKTIFPYAFPKRISTNFFREFPPKMAPYSRVCHGNGYLLVEDMRCSAMSRSRDYRLNDGVWILYPLPEYNEYYQFSRTRDRHRLIIILNQKRYILERDFKTITAGRAYGNFKGRYLLVTFSR
ncbi:uncharacterized protein LOC116916911 isoform X1 [Daphnia magna]|uniref:Uncharacterized protein n=1 Tax=Daphnia magna TaxID=35525 RepID=A0ABR0A7B2_9CRUS|nr:uncharacterized protein LOC116916911 isoform X1 [Daphnia magna]XP_032778105.1 uncharacterized protein LOC116916911 isoform X1 [Daphnia magna]XP_032778106.1 uncharacterized protein LOC116916911 isoform X1 [Daphnia magna]KAK4021032.1 hypothetical protein OUZ56_002965 [Daphnia magna]